MKIMPDTLIARHKIVDAARAMLDGRLSFIEGARQINRLRGDAQLPDFDADIMPFVAIDSETDALPLGNEKQFWQIDALLKLQPEIDRAEEWAKNVGHHHCLVIITRFAAKPAASYP